MVQKRTYRWLSLCLAAMALLSPSVSAWAQTPLLTSGTCGENTEWTFNESTKTLTISPKAGEENVGVKDYEDSYNNDEGKIPAPWKKYYDVAEDRDNNGPDELIEHIVVEDGIDVIGSFAFYNLPNLKDVVLAPSVRSIGWQALRYCPNLKSVVALHLGYFSLYGDSSDDATFDNNSDLTLYLAQSHVNDIKTQIEEGLLPEIDQIQVESFQLEGDGYETTTQQSSYELQLVKAYFIESTSTLKGTNTATVNGKTYTYKSGTRVDNCTYESIVKEGSDEQINLYDISEPGNYVLNTSINNLFTDPAKDKATTPLFAVTSSPTSGTGWAFDPESKTVTISGNLTGEPWSPFAGIISNVVVKKGVTQLPNKAFYDNELPLTIILQGADIDLNGSFMHTEYVYDDVLDEYVPKEVIYTDIYVPSSAVDAYKTAYADHLGETYGIYAGAGSFKTGDWTVTMPAAGVMALSNIGMPLDFSDCPGLKAYVATEFNPAIDKFIMEPVIFSLADDALVLKGTPGTEYTIPMGTWNSWRKNELKYGYDDVDPSDDPSYTRLKLSGAFFVELTAVEDPTGNVFTDLDKTMFNDRTDPSAPIGMLFTDEEPMTAGILSHEGDGARWTFDPATKTLTIDSNGYASVPRYSKEYEYNDGYEEVPAPWRTYTKHDGTKHPGIEADIEHIVVKDDIEDIGDYVFYGLPNLQTVSLAPSVYNLGNGAFQGCPNLQSVVVSNVGGCILFDEDNGCCTDGHGETFYVTSNNVDDVKSMMHGVNINIVPFQLTTTGKGMKVEFYSPLVSDGPDIIKGEIGNLSNWDIHLDGSATATVLGNTYNYADGSYVFNPQNFYLKDGAAPELKCEDVKEAGDYRVKATVEGLFTDAAKNTVISSKWLRLYTAPTSGEGWNFDRESNTLTITGDVTDEPWNEHWANISYVVVEEGVTQLPTKAFSSSDLNYAVIKSADVNLNGAFLRSFSYYDWDLETEVSGDELNCDIYVPAAAVSGYETAYSDYLKTDEHHFFPMDTDIEMKAASEGIMTFCSDVALDFSGCPELKAYKMTDFDPATGTLTLTRVMKANMYEGLVLKGATGTYTAQVSTCAYAEDNMLINIIDCYLKPEAYIEGTTYTNLVLAGTGANRGFHPLSAGGIVEGNKAYLQMKKADFDTWATSLAPIRVVYKDETEATDIEGIDLAGSAESDGAWYTLNGVRLQGKPATKGIYIKGGKKYVVK